MLFGQSITYARFDEHSQSPQSCIRLDARKADAALAYTEFSVHRYKTSCRQSTILQDGEVLQARYDPPKEIDENDGDG